jgi:hypothetical protein
VKENFMRRTLFLLGLVVTSSLITNLPARADYRSVSRCVSAVLEQKKWVTPYYDLGPGIGIGEWVQKYTQEQAEAKCGVNEQEQKNSTVIQQSSVSETPYVMCIKDTMKSVRWNYGRGKLLSWPEAADYCKDVPNR